MDNTRILDITNDVKWIGILDEDIVTFDIVMETQYGTTYNSYFINADKKAIIDTAKETFREVYIDKLKKCVPPEKIEYIIVSHTEPDHSGNIEFLLQLAPNARIVGSRQAINFLNEMISVPFDSIMVKDNDILDLGNKTLRFISAPNLHWPDTIYTYLEEDRLLFTCDSFGAHYCREEMFDDKVDDFNDAFKYYFDVILKPFSKFMVNAIEKINELNIEMVCPGHGPILRSTWKEKVNRSLKMAEIYLSDSACKDNDILITYVSAYGYTKQMAETIASGISEIVDYKIHIADIEHMSPGKMEELLVRSKSLLVGSPTINNNTLLPVYKLFSVINPVRDKSKKAAAFGSYGWSGEAVKIIENQLRLLKLNVVCESYSARFSPNKDKLQQLREFGKRFANHLLEE